MKQIFVIILATQMLLQLAAQDVMREQLPNGMTLLVREDHLTPAVSVLLAVKAAPRYESALLGSGASELLRRLKMHAVPSHLQQLILQSGHQISGNTTVDYTSYKIETTQGHLGSALQVLSAVVANRAYKQTDFDRERALLLNAQAKRDQSSHHLIHMALQRAFYRQAAYGVPVAGEALPLQRLDLGELINYDEQRYLSGNMILVINGNIAADNVKKAVSQFFASVPQGFTADQLRDEEPGMLASRSLNIEREGLAPELVLAWRTAPMEHNDQVILELLAAYLNAPNSPLRERLIASQLAESLSVTLHNQIGVPGYLEIRVALSSEETRKILPIIGEELANLQDKRIDEGILHQIRLQTQRQALLAKHNVAQQTESLLQWDLATGVPRFGKKLNELRNRVGSKHIQQAALQYLRSSHSCKLVLKPSPIENINQEPILPPPPITLVPPVLRSLENDVAIVERPLPMGLVHVVLSMGVDVYDERLEGINALLARMVTLRTATRGAQDLRNMLAQKGMQLNAHITMNALHIEATCFPEDTLFAIGLLADCVTRPNFQEADIEVHRQRLIAANAVRNAAATWQTALYERTLKILFSGHYASQSRFGNPQTLKDITVKAMHDHLRRLVQGANVVVSIYGSYDQKKTQAFLKQHLSNARLFPSGERLQPQGSVWNDMKTQSGSIVGDKDALAIAWRAPANNDSLKDKVALDVLVALAAGTKGDGGFVAEGNADKKFAILDAHLLKERYDQRGVWMWFMHVEKQQAQAARDAMLLSVKKVHADVHKNKNAVTERAIIRAKQMCRTAHLLQEKDQQQTALHNAGTILAQTHLNEVNDYSEVLSNLELDDLRRVADLYLKEPASILMMSPQKLEAEKVKILEPVKAKKLETKLKPTVETNTEEVKPKTNE